MPGRYVIISAGGSGSRMKTSTPKQFLLLDGIPVVMRSINAFLEAFAETKIILVLPTEYIHSWERLCDEYDFRVVHQICAGGNTRFQSVRNGLEYVERTSLVAVHDAVRPLITPQLIDACFRHAERHGNAVPAVQISDSIRQIGEEGSKSMERETFRLIQTPQVFRAEALLDAYQQDERPSFTDDASVIEAAGHKIDLVPGDERNIKITTPADMVMADAMLRIPDNA